MRYSLTKLLFIFTFFSASLSAQHFNYPLNAYSKYFLEQGDSSLLSSLQALPESWYQLDSVWGYRSELHYTKPGNTLNYDHLMSLDKEGLQVYVDLLLNFELGKELRDNSAYTDTSLLYRNLRGFSVKGNIGKKISFNTTFREIQSSFPRYLHLYASETLIVPGTGRIKPFSGTAFDHNIAEGYVSFMPVEQLNIQFGSQKNFIGSGYRSLLLSDNTFTYPQLKITASFLKGKLRYQMIHAWLQTLERLPNGDSPESLYKPKGGSFKYLEIRPIDALSIGFFEGIIWRRFDAKEGTLKFPTAAYNPVIGINSLVHDGNEDAHSMIGIDLTLRLIKGLRLYGQYAKDGEKRDAYQVGLRSVDLLLKGLSLSLEQNIAADATYASADPLMAYTHFGQALAHPMGSGFQETHIGIMYFHRRLFFNGRGTLAKTKALTGGDYAGDQLFTGLPAHGYDLKERELMQSDVRLGYFFNPKSNFNVYIGWLGRQEDFGDSKQVYNMISFGIDMSLFNTYEDF